MLAKNPMPHAKPPKQLLNVFRHPSVKEKTRGFANNNAMESQTTVIISRDVFGTGLKVKDRKFAEGTTQSKNIMPIDLLSADDPLEFRALPAEKAMIIGPANTIPMSGSSYIPLSEGGYESTPDKAEPVFFWSIPPKLAMEMLHSYEFERVVHMTAGNGAFAVAACMTRTPTLLMCHSELHKKKLRNHVILQLFRLKQLNDEMTSKVYDPELVQLIQAVEKELGRKPKETTPKKSNHKSAKDTTPPKEAKPEEAKEGGQDAQTIFSTEEHHGLN